MEPLRWSIIGIEDGKVVPCEDMVHTSSQRHAHNGQPPVSGYQKDGVPGIHLFFSFAPLLLPAVFFLKYNFY